TGATEKTGKFVRRTGGTDRRRLLPQQLFERLEGVGLAAGLVPADAVDAREAHRHPGFVAGRAVDAVEGDFEDDLGRHLAHRPPAPPRVVTPPLVETPQFLVGKSGIVLCDRPRP